MDSFGEPAKLVAEDGRALADELEQPVMDRPWFCSAYAAAGYFMCDPLTNVPKWCQLNMSDVWCPDDPGYEYDGVTGGGGSAGGAGAGRTWEVEKCYDSEFKEIQCILKTERKITLKYYNDTPNVYITAPVKKQTSWSNVTLVPVNANTFFQCVDRALTVVDCDLATKNPNGSISNIPFYNPITKNTLYISEYAFACYDTSTGYNNEIPCMINTTVEKVNDDSRVAIDSGLRLIDYSTGIPITNEKIENGYPIPVVPPEPVPNPFEPVVPETSEECATIICQCIAGVVRALGIVNASVLKVDESVLKVVSAITNYKPVLPDPFDIKPITDSLDAILKSIDDITVEIVKEAGTNFWDVLGGAFSDIFDLIEFLIEKVIYLVVPEDSSGILAAFDSLNQLISAKMKPVEQVKTAIDSSMNVQKKNFEDIYITLPAYGEVKFFETEYILIALPYVRRIMSAIMILMTAFYAYRKVSSEMIR